MPHLEEYDDPPEWTYLRTHAWRLAVDTVHGISTHQHVAICSKDSYPHIVSLQGAEILPLNTLLVVTPDADDAFAVIDDFEELGVRTVVGDVDVLGQELRRNAKIVYLQAEEEGAPLNKQLAHICRMVLAEQAVILVEFALPTQEALSAAIAAAKRQYSLQTLTNFFLAAYTFDQLDTADRFLAHLRLRALPVIKREVDNFCLVEQQTALVAKEVHEAMFGKEALQSEARHWNFRHCRVLELLHLELGMKYEVFSSFASYSPSQQRGICGFEITRRLGKPKSRRTHLSIQSIALTNTDVRCAQFIKEISHEPLDQKQPGHRFRNAFPRPSTAVLESAPLAVRAGSNPEEVGGDGPGGGPPQPE